MHDTPVAYKLPYFQLPQVEIGRKIIQGLTAEMRIVCHPSVENHTNIARLLGVAWVNGEDMGLYVDDDSGDWRLNRLPGQLRSLTSSTHTSKPKIF